MDCVDTDAPEADVLPSIDALIAGTVALMTTWADPCPHAPLPPADLRRLVACKVVTNLFFLQQHPLLSPPLRQSLAYAHARWMGLAQAEQPHAANPGAALGQALH